jgi:hypothetical protein
MKISSKDADEYLERDIARSNSWFRREVYSVEKEYFERKVDNVRELYVKERVVKPAGNNPRCENCGRATEYLFRGVIEPKSIPSAKRRNTVFDERLMKALSMPFQTQEGLVCQQCRPPSNWEIEEILRDASRNKRSNSTHL